MNVFHGNIISCDESDSVFSFLVENEGRILYTGNTLPQVYADWPLVELGESALVPAFADTHNHFSSFAFFLSGIHLSGFQSNREILEHLAHVHEASGDDILFGFGLSPHSVEEKRMITREELDRAVPGYPVFLVAYHGHSCVVNSTLVNLLPDPVKELRGYDRETGEMGQEAFYAIADYVTGSVSPMVLMNRVMEAYDFMTRSGFGMVHTNSGVGFPRDLDVDIERWMGRGLSGGFQTRVFFQTMDIRKVTRRRLPRIGGCFATALDGCFGSRDAALLEPYAGTDSKGILFYQDQQVEEFCIKANRRGLQIQMHAIGDAAFEQAAGALAAALKDFPRTDHRHGIIHACLPTERGLDLCGKYHIQILCQPAFLNWDQEPSWYLQEILGEREQRLTPLRDMQDRGIAVSGGSDAPVTFPDAIKGIHNACNHPNSGQSLTVLEALKMFTINGYKAAFDEKDGGSLEKGKRADMVILSENPLFVKTENLKSLKVLKTYLLGRESCHHRKHGLSTLVKGMFSGSRI